MYMGFPGGTKVKNLVASAIDVRDTGLTHGLGRSPGERHGHPLQDSCLENPMDRGAWRATVHGGHTELDTTETTCALHEAQHSLNMKVKVAQLCPTFYDPMDYRVHVNLQARILEWVAFPFSRGSSQSRGQTQVSRIAGEFFTSWATREAQYVYKCIYYFAKGRVCIILVKLKAAWRDRG